MVEDYAMESLFSNKFSSFFKSKKKVSELKRYREVIDESIDLLGNKPVPLPIQYKIGYQNVIISEEKSIIIIKDINFNLLFKRIKKAYGEKRLDLIFKRTYKKSDIAKYYDKKLQKSQMHITSLISPIFFALELSILFKQLGSIYNDSTYNVISDYIYNHSWLKQTDNNKADSVDIEYAQSLLNPKYKLQQYQIDFIKAYPIWKSKLGLRGIYNAFDQGLGKTLTAVSLAMSLHMDKIYIICPNSLVLNWYNEIKNYYDGKILSCICKNNEIVSQNTKFFITNNESIKSMLPYIDVSKKTMLIIDEGHNFRNLNGNRVKELLDFVDKLKPINILPMSGTPLKASPNEIVPILKLLDPRFTDTAAEMYYKCFNFDKYQAMEIVTARFGKFIYRKMKTDVLKLPKKNLIDYKVTISQPKDYLLKNVKSAVIDEYYKIFPFIIKENASILNDFKNIVIEYSTAPERYSLEYLKRICMASDDKNNYSINNLHELESDEILSFLDKFVISNKNFPRSMVTDIKKMESRLIHYNKVCMGKAIGKIYPIRRTQMFKDIWDENSNEFIDLIKNADKKTIIFSQFVEVVAYITKMLAMVGIKCVTISGGISSTNRQELIDQFKKDPNTKVIVATSQTIGTGVTLIEANQILFFGAPWRSADYDQCCDRIYRIGQECDVYIYNIILNTPELNLSSKMDKILKWSSDMFHNAIDNSIVTEGYIFNDGPLYLNTDKWENGETNVLYITGLSGSGKGFYARKFADNQPDVTTIELDKFENYIWYISEKEKNPNVRRGDKIIYQYLKNTYTDISIDVFHNDPVRYKNELKKFIIYLQEYMKNNPFTKFIVEGIQIFADDAFSFIDNTYPLVIIRTSMVKSMRKVLDRPHNTIRNRMHTHIDAQKLLSDFIDRLNIDTATKTEESFGLFSSNKKDISFQTPEKLYDWMKMRFKTVKHYRMKSIYEMMIVPRGSTHDQANFLLFYLRQMQLKCGGFFIIEYNGNVSGESHSIIWYFKNKKYYWIETAWEDHRGIYEFDSLTELMDSVRNLHKNGLWGDNRKYPFVRSAILNYLEGDTIQLMINRMFRPN